MAEEKTAKVTTTGIPQRTLFEGSDDDALEFVENNFPRAHSEGTGNDVTVTTSDGKKHSFVDGEWVEEKSSSTTTSKK